MKKRGQIAIFVIIAIVIVAAIFFIYYQSKGTNILSGLQKQDPAQQALIESKAFLQSCFDTSTQYSVYYTLSHGGSLNPTNSVQVPELGLVHKGFDITTNQITFPPTAIIQEQIAQHTIQEFLACFNISDFPDDTVTATTPPKITTKIKDNEIISYLEYPLTFNFGESTTRYEDTVITKIPISLTTLLTTTNGLLKTIEAEPESLDLFFIQEALTEITVIPLETGELVFILTDNDQTIEEVPLTIVFTMG